MNAKVDRIIAKLYEREEQYRWIALVAETEEGAREATRTADRLLRLADRMLAQLD